MKAILTKTTAIFVGSILVYSLLFDKKIGIALLYSLVISLAVLFYNLFLNKK